MMRCPGPLLFALLAAAPAAYAQSGQGPDSTSMIRTDGELSSPSSRPPKRAIDCKDAQSLRDTKDFFIGQLGWQPPEIDWHLYCLCGPVADESGYNSPGPATPEVLPARPEHAASPADKPKAKGKDGKGQAKDKDKDKDKDKRPVSCLAYEKEYATWFSGYLSLVPGQAAKLATCQDQWHHYGDKARDMTGPNANKKRDGKVGSGSQVKGGGKGKTRLKSVGFGRER